MTLASSAAPQSPVSGPMMSEPSGLIQCPDWQKYASPVSLVRMSENQTDAQFVTRTTRSSPTTSRDKTVSSRSDGIRQEQEQAARLLPTACSYTIKQGDTFGKIARATLGASNRWREIAALNSDRNPLKLRIGDTIALPCQPAPSVATTDTAPKTETTTSRWRWWPFGRTQQSSHDDTSSSPETTPANHESGTTQADEKAPIVDSPPLPIWEAAPNEYLRDVLQRWGDTAGYTVIIDTSDAWQLGVPIRIKAAFEAAVDELVSGLAHDGTPPRVRLYPNAVLRLGGPL
ncbi:MAG: TcpQ domain-containing protein [Aestuariivita sp.]|nr:TcpQ domain-containing protein [Aestuariivita sp.]